MSTGKPTLFIVFLVVTILLSFNGGLMAQKLPPKETPLLSPAPLAYACFGFSSAIGDVNGDGFNDLAVSAYRTEISGVPLAGEVFFFYGPNMTPAFSLKLPPPLEESRFGYSIAFGDFDNDGATDFVASARKGHPNGIYQAGRVFVYYGPTYNNPIELNEPTVEYNAVFGYDVSTGDINGDNYDDLAIGARLGKVNGVNHAGEVFVFYGPDLKTVTALTEPNPETIAVFGTAVVIADLDGDPYMDLVVGSHGASVGSVKNVGEVHIFKGPNLTYETAIQNPAPTPEEAIFGYHVSCGDTNGDGLDDIQVGAPYQTTAGLYRAGAVYTYLSPNYTLHKTIEEPQPQSDSSFGRALAAGDVNNDGNDDLAIAVTYADVNGVGNTGEAYLYFGPGFDKYVHLQLKNPEKNDEFGTSCIGDIDADGYMDVFVGARTAKVNGQIQVGKGVVYDFSTWHSFSPFGHGTHGSGGVVPKLTGSNELINREEVIFSISDGLGGAPGLLIFSPDLAHYQLNSLALYLGSMPIILNFNLSGAPGVVGAGDYQLRTEVHVPPSLVGTMLYSQALVADPGGPNGQWSATNGMKLVFQQ